MFQKVRVRALGAVEEIFLLVLFAFGGAGIRVGVRHFGRAAVDAGVDAVPIGDYGGEGGDGEDVAGRKKGDVSLGSGDDERGG